MKSIYTAKIWNSVLAKSIAEWKAKLDKKRQEEIRIKELEREEQRKLLPKPKGIAEQRKDMIEENKAKGFFKGTIDEINSANQSKLES